MVEMLSVGGWLAKAMKNKRQALSQSAVQAEDISLDQKGFANDARFFHGPL